MSDLPEDLQVEILTRLPVKSLLRFRSVSKLWSCSISSSNFITDHIKKSTNNIKIDRQDLLGCNRNGFFLLNTMNKEIKECPRNDRKVYAGYFGIVGSCRGIVYLHNSVANKHVLWNPSIRKYIEIPQSEFMSLSGFHPQLLGFGYDPFTDDYKLVTGVYKVDRDKYEDTTEVYSLKRRKWQPVTRRSRIRHVILKDSVFLNGSCHWIVTGYSNNYSDPKVTKFILTFDIQQEVFGQIAAVPSPMHELNILVSSEGLLSLASSTNQSANVDIWTMKEYGVAESWTKIFRIEHPLWGMRNVVGFWRNEEVLFTNVGGKLVCYDIRTKSKLDCKMYGEPEYTFRGDTYFDSLVLLDQLQVSHGGLGK